MPRRSGRLRRDLDRPRDSGHHSVAFLDLGIVLNRVNLGLKASYDGTRANRIRWAAYSLTKTQGMGVLIACPAEEVRKRWLIGKKLAFSVPVNSFTDTVRDADEVESRGKR